MAAFSFCLPLTGYLWLYIGPTQIIQENLSLQDPSFNYICRDFFFFIKVPGVKNWYLWEPLFSLLHTHTDQWFRTIQNVFLTVKSKICPQNIQNKLRLVVNHILISNTHFPQILTLSSHYCKNFLTAQCILSCFLGLQLNKNDKKEIRIFTSYPFHKSAILYGVRFKNVQLFVTLQKKKTLPSSPQPHSLESAPHMQSCGEGWSYSHVWSGEKEMAT